MCSARLGRYRCAFDIGGTFTDFVLLDGTTGKIEVHKSLTTPANPALGALEGLDVLIGKAGIGYDDVSDIVHGTTLVTNLIIEKKGACTALITTKGFRDIIEIGTEQRYDIHDIFLRFPDPMVPRSRRYEIAERMSRDGDVITPMDLDEVRAVLKAANDDGVKAIAVVLLHSYRNSSHEKAVEALARKEFPQLYVSISAEVCGEIREYERAMTTVANAYAQPIVEPYVDDMERMLKLRGFSGRLYLMQSSGDLASPEMVKRLPVRLLESGPAGGGLAAAHFGKMMGRGDVIAFDMGGTTAKVCLIHNGKVDVAPMLEAAREHRFKRGSGLPIRAPVIDLIEIGAGGGSIAKIDEIGLLKVGPHSSGAEPGPACYGRGGAEPTVTDANLLLGYLAPESFLGGRLTLDRAAAKTAFGPIAKVLDKGVEDAAWGVFSVVCENMAGAARVHVVEKGRDPRRFAMIAFGGAGPAHAVRVAKSLGVSTVIVPPASGAASAFGFLSGAVAHEASRSYPSLVADADWGTINALLCDLEQEGRDLLATANIVGDAIMVTREVDLRLHGQLHTLRVRAPIGALDVAVTATLADAFAVAYQDLYGRTPPDGDLEIIGWRVTTRGPAPELADATLANAGSNHALKGERPAWFPETNGFVNAKIYSRYNLASGVEIVGPAIIEENESTTVVPPGDRVSVDAHGNLVIAVSSVATRVATHAPRAATVEDLENDPVGLEIMWSRLVTISEECWLTVIRTAFSMIIGEAQDFACEILDDKGNSLAHSPRAMPVFNISLMTAVRAMLEVYPVDTLKPGDVLITNDPWICAGHLFDLMIVSPVFHGGRVVAFVGSVGHVSDIGGTKDRANARELYEEGLQIPPMKLFSEGKPNDDLFRILAMNVRNSRQVVGDVQSLVAASQIGAERLVAFMEEYGLTDLTALATVIQGRAERSVREEIRKVPNGVYTSTAAFNGAGERLEIPVKITVNDDTIEVDYEGCPPQVAKGGINCTGTVTWAETLFALKCVFSPSIRATAGCYRPFTVKAPEGSLLNCSKPASVALRRLTMWHFIGMIFRALSPAIPDRVQAYTGLPSLIDLYGFETDGRIYSDHIFVGGGQGACHDHDGKSGLIWPTSAANTSIEMVESRLPVLVTEKALLTDSGGSGKFRGGLGQVLKLRLLHNTNQPFFVNVYPEGSDVMTDGLLGGLPGGSVRAFHYSRSIGAMRELEKGTMIEINSAEDIVEVRLGGGAGFGSPHERDAALIQYDLTQGYISANPSGPHRLDPPPSLAAVPA
ncbi:hydantoinase B/oxoprolinase family protein [Pseudorhodoplanes sp.]|uniref:hydantoinase B/oxoprolinase family protein n=1 Tax=Pseudorhodoplanes sp. TaxID=1934341 RepID=UPI003D145691